MLVVNLAFLALAVAQVVIAVIGLRGSWPMQLASFLALTGWVVTIVWAAINTVRLVSGDDDLAPSLGLASYVLLLAVASGLGLAFLAFVKCGPPVVPRVLHALGLTALLVAIAGVIVVQVTGAEQKVAAPTWLIVLAVALPVLWGLAWLIPYLLLRGSVELTAYAAARSDFLLPFPGGRRCWVIQGNNSAFNHNHDNFTQGFAWDFRRGCGTPVLAAAAGRVSRVIDSNDGIGGANNLVEIEHPDGSVASYLHIGKGSARVAVGAAVNVGDQLADVGSVGHSLTGHIHFHVRQGADTVPVRFADVTRHGGVPRGFCFYTSGNAQLT